MKTLAISLLLITAGCASAQPNKKLRGIAATPPGTNGAEVNLELASAQADLAESQAELEMTRMDMRTQLEVSTRVNLMRARLVYFEAKQAAEVAKRRLEEDRKAKEKK